MADDEERARDEAHKQSLRPTPTLDLHATDVSPAPEGSTAGNAAPPPEPEQPPKPAAAPVKPPARSNIVGHVAAAIVGALIAIAAIYLLDQAQLLPPRPDAQAARTAQQVAVLQHRIADVEKRTAAASRAPPPPVDEPARRDIQRLNGTLSDLQKSVAALQQRVGGLASTASKPLPDDLQHLPEQVTKLATAMNELSTRLQASLAGKASAADLQTLAQQIAGQQQALAKSETVNPAQIAAQAHASSALAAVAALEGAVARGVPYGDLLGSVGRLLPGQNIAPLQAYADHGAPSLAALRTSLAADLTAAPNPAPPANAGLLDRLLASARSLVRITPVNPSARDIEGDGDMARRSRVIAALDRGDDAAALQGWNGLDAAARTASMDAANALRRRVEAGQVMTGLSHAALAALTDATAGGQPQAAPQPGADR